MPARPHDADDPEDAPRDEPGPGQRPGDGDGDEDRLWEQRWEELVAQLRPDGAGGDGSTHAPSAGRPEADGDGTDQPPGASHPPRRPEDPRSWSPDPEVEAEEERFVPPDPGPVLSGDPLLTMAWAAAVGAPALLLLALVLLGRVDPVLARVAGVAFLIGVAVLVWRMPRDRSDDDGPGAVV